MSLTTIIGPPIMNNIFKYFTTKNAPVHFPGAFFLLAAIFMLVSVLIAYSVLQKEKTEMTAKAA
jgi:DHA1 family tetracycline resistance protein-like MFS transporter